MDVRNLQIVDYEQLRALLRKEGVPELLLQKKLRVRHPVWWDSAGGSGIVVAKKVSALSRFVRRKGPVVAALVKPDLLIRVNGTYVHLDNPISSEGATTADMHGFKDRNTVLVSRLVEAFPRLQEIELPSVVPADVAKIAVEVYGWEAYVNTLTDFW